MSSVLWFDLEMVDNGSDDPGGPTWEDQKPGRPGKVLLQIGEIIGVLALQPNSQKRYIASWTSPVTR